MAVSNLHSLGMPFTFICRKLFLVNKFFINSKAPLASLHNKECLLNPISRNQRYITSSTKKSCKGDHYTVSCLTNQCGLSLENAIFASKYVHLKTPESPDSVLTLFRNHGFTKTQIAKIVRSRPRILRSDPQKTLLPKLQFLQSIGASNTHLAAIFSRDPSLFTTSIENNIIPSYNFLKSVLPSNQSILTTLKRAGQVFRKARTKNLVPNFTVLKDLRVPQSCIVLLLTNFPETVMQKPDKFRETVNELLGMGFDPFKSMFVLAIHVLSGRNKKSTWDRGHRVYKKWGWSDDEILLAFKKHPHCMALTEKKISGTMNFFVNKMGRKSIDIARNPTVLCYNLEKRIIPRCSVIQVLLMKGLIKNVSMGTVLKHVEKYFLKRFVKKYEEEVPQLSSVYQGKLNGLEL